MTLVIDGQRIETPGLETISGSMTTGCRASPMGGAACRRPPAPSCCTRCTASSAGCRSAPASRATAPSGTPAIRPPPPATSRGTSPSTPTGPWCSPPTSRAGLLARDGGQRLDRGHRDGAGSRRHPLPPAARRGGRALRRALRAPPHRPPGAARNGVPIVGVVPRLTGHDGPWSGVFGTAIKPTTAGRVIRATTLPGVARRRVSRGRAPALSQRCRHGGLGRHPARDAAQGRCGVDAGHGAPFGEARSLPVDRDGVDVAPVPALFFGRRPAAVAGS